MGLSMARPWWLGSVVLVGSPGYVNLTREGKVKVVKEQGLLERQVQGDGTRH